MDADGLPPYTLAARGGRLRYSPPRSLTLLTALPFPTGGCIPSVALAQAPASGDMDHSSRGGGGGGGGREDCWSEEATGALVEAWGDRFVELSRGNLRQKDWKDVADLVNDHLEAAGKPRKTDIQCKNRIDTLKKKYKIEKARAGPSQWTFFPRLDILIGPGSSNGSAKKAQNTGALAVKPQSRPLGVTSKHRAPANPNPKISPSLCSEGSSSRSKMNSSPVSSESSRGDDGGGGARSDDDLGVEEDVDEGGGLFRGGKVSFGRRRPWGSSLDVDRVVGGGGGSGGDDGMDGAFVELAKAIVKFGEIYERVESSKQNQMLELERQRMEFAKELEFQRMQMFMEAQLELEKMKRPKYAFGTGKRI